MARRLFTDWLYFGDNLEVLRRHVDDESVDLVYLDPPFKSNRNYNQIFREKTGNAPAAQIRAFKDTWRWDEGSALVYRQVVEQGGDVGHLLEAFHDFLSGGTARRGNDMLAYLTMMAPRLLELQRVLKPEGTIYLHCDPTASHYLKLLLDAVFGPRNFLNEVVWHYETSSGRPQKWLIRDHDIILRYAATDPALVTWNHPRLPWPETTLRKWQTDEQGRVYREQKKFGKRYYANPEGKLDDDVWPITLASRSAERLGYPTQKPLELLTKIVKASSNPGDLVLDPFCGCGTAIDAAQRLGRRWIGIDVTYLAIDTIKSRLTEQFGAVDYAIGGEPTTVDEARHLAELDPFQFQLWACGLVGARGARERTPKRGPDRGIDGELVLVDARENQTRRAIISVKSGQVSAPQVTALRGTVERVGAEFGLFICFERPKDTMRREAADAGFVEDDSGDLFARIQILTIEELLAGTRPKLPWNRRRRATDRSRRAGASSRRAGRASVSKRAKSA